MNQRIRDLLAVWEYNPNQINKAYAGGMARTAALHIVGLKYGKDQLTREFLEGLYKFNREKFDKLYAYLKKYVSSARQALASKCRYCGRTG